MTIWNCNTFNHLLICFQVFKTENCGWGIRCLDDIPKGQFICVYAGEVLNEQEANKDGIQDGDEYLVGLDIIEVVEDSKFGYESSVKDIEQLSGMSSTSDNSGKISGNFGNSQHPVQ